MKKQIINNPDFSKINYPLVDVVLKNLRSHGIDVVNQTFQGSLISNIILESSLIENCAFMNSSLEKVDLKETVVSATSFFSCLMTDLQAESSHFEGVSFYKTDLRGSNFKGASFEGCLFEGTDLSCVDFSGADLSLCNFYGCHSVVGAIFDHETQLPFSTKEAKSLGMVLKENKRLTLAVSFDDAKKDLMHPQAPNTGAVVLDFSSYRKKQNKK